MVVADGAVWFVGSGYGPVGMVVAIGFIIWTQRKADALWRARLSSD